MPRWEDEYSENNDLDKLRAEFRERLYVKGSAKVEAKETLNTRVKTVARILHDRDSERNFDETSLTVRSFYEDTASLVLEALSTSEELLAFIKELPEDQAAAVLLPEAEKRLREANAFEVVLYSEGGVEITRLDGVPTKPHLSLLEAYLVAKENTCDK